MQVTNYEQTLKLLRSHSKEIKQFGVSRLGFFGSLVRGELQSDSDIDVIVEFENGKKNFRKYMALYYFLQDQTSRKVDLLTPESIDPLIKPYIDKEIRYEKF